MEAKVVVAAVIHARGKFLLQKRTGENHANCDCTDREELMGKWEFPGGKVEDNEDLEEALVREIFEELNVRIDIISLHHAQVTQYGSHNKNLVLYYICWLFIDEDISESETIRWVSGATEAKKLDCLPGTVEVLEKF